MRIENGILLRASAQNVTHKHPIKSLLGRVFHTLKNTACTGLGYGLYLKAKEIGPNLIQSFRNIDTSSFRFRYNWFYGLYIEYMPSVKYEFCQLFANSLFDDLGCAAQEGERIVQSAFNQAALAQKRVPLQSSSTTFSKTIKYLGAQLTIKHISSVWQIAGGQIVGFAICDELIERALGNSLKATVIKSLISATFVSATCSTTGASVVPVLAIYAGSRFICSLSVDALRNNI